MGLKREEGPWLSHFTDGENEDQGGYVTCTPLFSPPRLSAVALCCQKMNLFWQTQELGKHSEPDEKWEGFGAVHSFC